MKRLVCMAVVGVLLLGGLEWQRRRRADRPRELPTVSRTASPNGFPQQREGVGWVFGRLVGIPGAEKPLSGGNTLSFQAFASPPPAALPPAH